jgi:hypothetical protein
MLIHVWLHPIALGSADQLSITELLRPLDHRQTDIHTAIGPSEMRHGVPLSLA